MTVYDIPNIEHCTVIPFGNAIKLKTESGWYIHLNDDVEDTTKLWKTVVILRTDYDWSLVEIRAEADLPEDAETCGDANKPEIK